MPILTLVPPTPADAESLLEFELANRTYFESHINARPPSFYSTEGVVQAIAQAQRDAADDKGFQYLVRDAAGRLVGRVNFSRVRRAHFHSAELGYRIAEAETGKGYAKQAVRLALDAAGSAHGLLRVEATARPENSGSVSVLSHNGFTSFGRSTRSFELGGRWFDLLHFERDLQG